MMSHSLNNQEHPLQPDSKEDGRQAVCSKWLGGVSLKQVEEWRDKLRADVQVCDEMIRIVLRESRPPSDASIDTQIRRWAMRSYYAAAKRRQRERAA